MDITIASAPELAVTAADLITELLAKKPDAVLGLATGSSPLLTYDELVRRYQAGEVSFAQARAFTLDEYVGLPAGHPERYCHVIEREFTNRVDLAVENVHGPDGLAEDLEHAGQALETAIKAAGGVDLQLLGIGSNGHIAFNEPGSPFDSRTRMLPLTEQTRRDNSRFFDGDLTQVPTHCITQGLGTIMEAKHLVLVATGEGKAEAVRELVYGDPSPQWPATVLQSHPNVMVLLDPAAASLLRP